MEIRVAWTHDVGAGVVEVTFYKLVNGKREVLYEEVIKGEAAERFLLKVDELKS